ncbi:MAG: hypothetical protein P8P30_07265 [Rickettsiales bacterium]|nr:hypothetical protein [Rickettsiales bacterium]
MVSQWWYHARPQVEESAIKSTGIRHNPSTITTVGGHGHGRK